MTDIVKPSMKQPTGGPRMRQNPQFIDPRPNVYLLAENGAHLTTENGARLITVFRETSVKPRAF